MIKYKMVTASTETESVSVSVYYVAVRTIVLSCHGSYLARPVIIYDIIHGLIYVPSTPCCELFGEPNPGLGSGANHYPRAPAPVSQNVR